MPNLINKALFLLLINAILLAVYWSHVIFPKRMALEPVKTAVAWLDVPEISNGRAFFRNKIMLDSPPENAWMGISTNDYDLYINGTVIAGNKFSMNASSALQSKMMDRGQGIFRPEVVLPRTPVLKKGQNQEWKLMHYVNIAPYLRLGENQIAIATQTYNGIKLGISGRIYNNGAILDLADTGQPWRVSTTRSKLSGLDWFELDYNDSGWKKLVPNIKAEPRVYSTAPAQIWDMPYSGALEIPKSDNTELYLGLDLAETPLIDSLSKQSWLRIFSDWPYTIFLNGNRIGSGSGGKLVDAYDLRGFVSFLHNGRLSLLIERPEERLFQASPRVIIDGEIAGKTLDGLADWELSNGYNTQWMQGKGQWHSLEKLSQPPVFLGRTLFHPELSGEMTDIAHYLLLFVATSLFLALYARFLLASGYFSSCDNRIDVRFKINLWWSLLLAFLISAEVLRFRFAESDALIWMLASENAVLIFIAPIILMLLLSLLFVHKDNAEYKPQSQKTTSYLKPRYFFLVLILLAGTFLRLYGISEEDLQADENVSWDAAIGIMETGVPEAISGVLYTRSPLYHYFLAGWLEVFGNDKGVARSLASAAGVISLFIIYLLGSRISGRAYVGLLAALLVALDSWQIHVSQIIRFYQLMQLFSLLSMYYFLRGFIWTEGKKYQNLFFVFCLAAVLSQEVFVIAFPAFCIAGFLFYKPFFWKKDLNVVIGFVTLMTITVFDIGTFSILCLTPHVGISTSSGSIMQLHMIDVLMFLNVFFYGNLYVNIPYTLLFIAGMFYWTKYPDKAVSTFYLMVFFSILTSTILVMQIVPRYLFGIYPYLVLIAVLTFNVLLKYFWELLSDGHQNTHIAKKRWLTAVSIIFASTMCVALEPVKIVDSFTDKVNFQHESAYHFIQENMQAGDKIITVSPMAGAIVLGKVDYYLMDELAFDELYWKNDEIVERWAGGILVSNLGMVRDVLNKNRRVWFILDEMETPKLSIELAEFIESVATDRFEFRGGRLLLWDAGDAIYAHAEVSRAVDNSF